MKGRFNGGFFALPVWGACIWRGLYIEGLIFGILRYFLRLYGGASLMYKITNGPQWIPKEIDNRNNQNNTSTIDTILKYLQY